MSKKLKFRISSALKDIIGRDLITDDNVAVFELVKNGFDAHATRVDIIFKNLRTKNPKIIIKDNGKGMSYDDLLDRWLFVAYSAKKEGTEDKNFDYRDNIYSKRAFAGAKGIGRFSCDRLGKYLYLETTKKERNAKTEVLITDWEKFEEDIKEEFININVLYETKKGSDYGLVHGTVLEITDLRSNWDRDALLKLKDSLAKLINPHRGKSEKGFKIFIDADDELEEDSRCKDEREKVNGEVQNFVFEELDLKTTKIQVSLSGKGSKSYMTTSLVDGGTLIYKIKEINSFKRLWDIDFTLYYLNRSAKYAFARKMGLASRLYGHVFLYKNGFRIYPFGEPFEDPLNIDVRKSRKKYSYLGTGELMGQIQIYGQNPEFKETSSRGNGLIINPTYEELVTCFFLILSRLEKYVVDIQQWGLSIEDENTNPLLKAGIAELVTQISGSEGILEFEAPKDLISILEDSQVESASSLVKNLRGIAIATKNDDLLKVAKAASKKLKQIIAAKEEAEGDAASAREELNEILTQNLFLKSVKSQDLDEVVSFMHSIGISASVIDNYLSSIYQKINKGFEIRPGELKKAIEAVSFENRKILSITRFSTKANFKLYAEDATLDMVSFIKEYVFNILKPLRGEDVTITIEDGFKGTFIKKFRPIEMSILIDNLLSNSIRAKSRAFKVVIDKGRDKDLLIEFIDDGMGIPDKNINKIFKFGFTTTSGSGLGLHHAQEIALKLGGKLVADNRQKKGVKFVLTLKK